MLAGLQKKDFPFFEHHKDAVYLDNAATTHKPRAVIDAISDLYSNEYSSVHRALYPQGERTTRLYENVRKQVAQFINGSPEEIVFTSGATAALNMVAEGWGRSQVKSGDEIVVSQMEHHSNLLPWIRLAEQVGAELRYLPVTPDGSLDIDQLDKCITMKTRVVAITQLSNVTGAINSLEEIVTRAHACGAIVVIDAAQSAPHFEIDVCSLDADFVTFSAHKMYGPTGCGVLYGKKRLLSEMEPLFVGGGMVRAIEENQIDWQDVPYRFEAGTPNIAGVIGLGAAMEYINHIGLQKIASHEKRLFEYAKEQLSALEEITFLGEPKQQACVLSFTLCGVHPHDAASYLGEIGIALRAGQHCAQPYLQQLGAYSSLRMSIGIYNSKEDIDRMVDGLGMAKEFFNAAR